MLIQPQKDMYNNTVFGCLVPI